MNANYIHSNNLPTSFDVTPLLSKLKRLEEGGGSDDSRAVNNNNAAIIERVTLMELDPHYEHNEASDDDGNKIRLFLAAAYGKNVVVAQLIALELGHDVRDDGINNDEIMSTEDAGGGGLEIEEDELEWIDVSADRILSHEGNTVDDEVGVGDPVVVFPPSLVGLGAHNSSVDEHYFAADITSCALIPSPAIQTPNSNRTIMTNRTVALMIGTAHDQVLSLLLNVSETTITGPDTATSSSMDNNLRFMLEYDDCKIIENGGLKEDHNSSDSAKYPRVHQILPREKRFGPDSGVGEEDDSDTLASHNNTQNENVQVFYPSLPQSTPQQDDEGEEKKEGTSLFSGIKSISFRRDKFKSKRSSHPFGDDTRRGKEGGAITMHQDIIWITYGNGTIVKLPSWRPFIAFQTDHSKSSDGGGVVDNSTANMLGDGSSSSVVVVPLDTPFRSPLDIPLPQLLNHRNHPVSPDGEIESMTQGANTAVEYWNLLSLAVSSQDAQHHHSDPSVKALVLAGQSAPVTTPPIAFNSSRVKCDPSSAHDGTDEPSEYGSTMQQGYERDDHHLLDVSSEDEQYGPVTGTVVDSTAALVKGALGVALGAVRWGLGGRTSSANEEPDRRHFDNDDTPLDEFMEVNDTLDDGSHNHGVTAPSEQLLHSRMEGRGPFIKNGGAHDLLPWPLSSASFPFSDNPRRFETATVDPSGSLAATTDNLGRVVLFDLETNQPIRMFKGMRNVSCYFAELHSRLYLVIHLRQRGTVEIYRLQQGPRVSAVAVPHQKDCVVIACYGPPSEGCKVDSFLLERIDESKGEGCHFIVDKLVIDDPDALVATALPTKEMTAARSTSQSENKMQLKILMQLLAPDTNIKCNAQTVLTTFKSIRALPDLGEGLDALSRCSRLEGEMGIDGSSLHSQAVSYCKSRLNHAKQVESQEGTGMVRKSQISDLSAKLAYHDRLVHAYNVLHRYEGKYLDSPNSSSRDNYEGGGDNMETLSPWASEALSWISAASGNDALKTRFIPSFPDVHNEGDNKPLEFAKFAMSCRSNGDNDRVYLTKVKRSRLPILRRIFRPLLQDLFVFKVVASLFGNLGTDEDFVIQQQYFGEWISSLPTHDIEKSNMSGTWRPMIRWLQDLILNAYEMTQHGDQKLGDDLKQIAMLESLMKFCAEMEDLPKAFLLSVICMDAVSSASLQLEQKTYGKITQLEARAPWEDLLRKLRVCLLVSLRLGGDVNPFGGVDPMTVSNVSRPGIFSPYSWIARDELSLSHDTKIIFALESACISSSEAFYPSSVDGDNAQHKNAIFKSCSNPRQCETLHKPTGITNDTHSSTLLFFLKDHARFTTHLAANRALILASMWGQAPHNLNLLNHAIATLQLVVDSVENFSLATLVEIYQTRIRPVCRAMLFGFGEHELSEETVSPLIEDQDWLRDFITAVKRILSMIIECMSKTPSANAENKPDSSEMWPPLRECPVLNVLVKKLGTVRLTSVELHHTVVFAFQMTRNIDSLKSVVPTFGCLFLIGSLFSEMPPMHKGSVEQKGLLNKAILDHAAKSSRPVIDSFSCIKDVELFGKALGLGIKFVRTQYLIEMIRLGKDASIDDLLGSSISSLDKTFFVEKVMQIVCARLHATILSLKQTKHYRGILSLLDADASRWVRDEAVKFPSSQQSNYATASLITTHSLVTRVKSLSEDLEASISENVDALCLMSGTLLKAVQAQEQEAVMRV